MRVCFMPTVGQTMELGSLGSSVTAARIVVILRRGYVLQTIDTEHAVQTIPGTSGP